MHLLHRRYVEIVKINISYIFAFLKRYKNTARTPEDKRGILL